MANPSSAMSTNTEAPTPKPVKAPLGGIIVSVILALAFAVWTGTRILSATNAKKVVAEKRQEDEVRAQALASSPLAVSVVVGEQTQWQPVVQFDGTLQAAQAAALGFKVGGRISSIRVSVGQEVKLGAVLGTLDATEASAQLRAAEAQVRAAEAQYEIAADNARRTTAMVATGSVAEASGVQTTQQAALAAAQLDAAKAQVALIRVALANHSLTSPFAGTVTRVPDGIGAVVAPGVVQFEVVDTRSLRLRSTVSELDANLIKPGAAVSIETDSGPVMAELSAVLGSVDPNTRRVPVEATLKNNDKLRAGTFVKATVKGDKPLSVLKFPHTVLRQGSQNEVFVVENSAVVQRHIVYALDRDGALLVRSGVASAEQVVVSPKPETKAGDRVSVALGVTP